MALGWTHYKRKDYVSAGEEFSQAIIINPGNAYAFTGRAGSYMHQGNLEAALADLNKALAINDRLLVAYQVRGIVYAKQGDFDRAAKDFQALLRLDPNHAEGKSLLLKARLGKGVTWITSFMR
jgi:tetratricopeptide (TPR) repeat protein